MWAARVLVSALLAAGAHAQVGSVRRCWRCMHFCIEFHILQQFHVHAAMHGTVQSVRCLGQLAVRKHGLAAAQTR